ncbi:MAG: hypothetical protein HYV65_03335 [Candidatus Spechtbacteria bacterium]|nr:hypothetical protein [Candidatus Spechtbacteria bacterium]
MITIRNGHHVYQVGKKVAEAGKYRLYLCTQEGVKREYILQIANETKDNGALQRAAYILKELQRRAEELEVEYARPDEPLNYQLGFPELMDSFICTEQGGRQVNVFAFRNVENVGDMVPLINITAKDRLRVDLRTSAWIMGKLLKLLAFLHNEGISVNLLSGKNIVIEPKEHYVVIFEWSFAQIHTDTVPVEVRRQEISQAAQSVVVALGGDLKTGTIPNDGDEAFRRYTDYLWRLARGSESNAERAHLAFYELIDLLWERKYHPFTTESL